MTPKTSKFASLAVASLVAVMLASTGAFAASNDNASNKMDNQASNQQSSNPQAKNQQTGQQPGVAGQGQQDVKKAQSALKDQGFDVGSVDGIMGPKTQSALKQYQQKKGLNVTGQLDQQTRSDLGVG